MKEKILRWLLKDKNMRKIAIREIIGDKEVKQVFINNSADVTISDCYLIHSKISENENVKITNNVMEYCSITGNMNL